MSPLSLIAPPTPSLANTAAGTPLGTPAASFGNVLTRQVNGTPDDSGNGTQAPAAPNSGQDTASTGTTSGTAGRKNTQSGDDAKKEDAAQPIPIDPGAAALAVALNALGAPAQAAATGTAQTAPADDTAGGKSGRAVTLAANGQASATAAPLLSAGQGDGQATANLSANSRAANLSARTNVNGQSIPADIRANTGQSAFEEAIALARSAAPAHAGGAPGAEATAAQAAALAAQSAAAAAPQAQAQAALPLALQIAPHVTSQDWGDALSKQAVWLSNAHQQVAELHLNPPDLGPLRVVLNVADAQAQALFVSPHAAVRDAVQAALPQLRDSLAGNGISLGSTTVSADTSSQQQAFAQPGQSGHAQPGSPRRQGDTGRFDGAGPAIMPSAPRQTGRLGLVDTFA